MFTPHAQYCFLLLVDWAFLYGAKVVDACHDVTSIWGTSTGYEPRKSVDRCTGGLSMKVLTQDELAQGLHRDEVLFVKVLNRYAPTAPS